MSRTYSIDATINMTYDLNNIIKILQKGYNELNFQYFKPTFSIFDITENDIINIQSAANIFLNGSLIDHDLVNFIIVKKSDTYFNLHIIKDGTDTLIAFGNFCDPNLKKFDNEIVDIAISQYIKIILDLTENYRILKLLVEKN